MEHSHSCLDSSRLPKLFHVEHSYFLRKSSIRPAPQLFYVEQSSRKNNRTHPNQRISNAAIVPRGTIWQPTKRTRQILISDTRSLKSYRRKLVRALRGTDSSPRRMVCGTTHRQAALFYVEQSSHQDHRTQPRSTGMKCLLHAEQSITKAIQPSLNQEAWNAWNVCCR